jgi:hypothetical protein
LLSIKKAEGNDYWPVQDLQAVNNAIITLHPVVPNPYILLTLLPPQASWVTCLDLKDTFFCLCLALVSQPLFAFEWEDPHTGRETQMAWTRLPQEFKKLTHLVWGSPSGGSINFPRRKSKLYFAPIRG